MDNVTHTLVGLALAETGLKRATPLATATMVIAANFPDLDIVAGLLGNLFYLEHHRGITHAIVMIPPLALLLAGAVFYYARKKQIEARFQPLFWLSLLAMATHPLLDYLNSYGWRPFLPWNQTWYYGDTAFVIDPWLWVFLGGTLFVTTVRTKRQIITWATLCLAMAVVVFFAGKTGILIKILWLMLVAVVVVLWMFVRQTERLTRLAITTALVVALLYVGVLSQLHNAALNQAATLAVEARNRDGGAQVHINALPLPANPLLWRIVLATEKSFYLTELDLLKPVPAFHSMDEHRRVSGDNSTIEAARQTAQAQTFLRFARFPVSRVLTFSETGNFTEVEIRDIRFQEVDRNTFRTIIRFDKNASDKNHPSAMEQ